jgi:uncharacterized protein YkwD
VGFINCQCNGSQADIINGILYQTNIYRAWHCVPPLALNNSISAVALTWSQTQARTNLFQHNPSLGTLRLGENIYLSYSSAKSGLTCYSKILFQLFYQKKIFI